MLRYQHQTHLDHQTFACNTIPTLLKVGSKQTTKHQGIASEHCIISPFNGSISVSAFRGKHVYAAYVQSGTQICSLVPFQVSQKLKAIHPMGLGLILSIQVQPLILQQAQNRVTTSTYSQQLVVMITLPLNYSLYIGTAKLLLRPFPPPMERKKRSEDRRHRVGYDRFRCKSTLGS